MGGVLGLDMGAALQVAALLGYDQTVMALLLPAAEAGMVEGYRKLDDKTTGDMTPDEE